MGAFESKQQKEEKEQKRQEMERKLTCPNCNYRYRDVWLLNIIYQQQENHKYICVHKPVVPAIYREVRVSFLDDILSYLISKEIIPYNYAEYYRDIKLIQGEISYGERYNWKTVGGKEFISKCPFSYYIDRSIEREVPFSVHTGLITQEWKNAVKNITTATNFDRINIIPSLCMKIGTVIITLSSYREIDEFLVRLRPFVFPKEE